MIQNVKTDSQQSQFTRKIAGPVTPDSDLPMHGHKQTGWRVIGVLAFLFSGVFAGGLLISGESLEQFFREREILTWIGAAFIALCILAELSRLKCPNCRSRAIALVSAEEVDRWIGQKIVNEETVGVGGFQAFGESKLRGMT